jgi:hypothetical protein
MGMFPRSFVDLDEIPLVTPKLTLIIPHHRVRFTTRQIGLKELSQQPILFVAARHYHESSDRWSISEKQSQDAEMKAFLASRSSAMSLVPSASASFMTSASNRMTTAGFAL